MNQLLILMSDFDACCNDDEDLIRDDGSDWW